ncbi:Uncharacterized protein HZ326_1101 [Fusarium oxysporum f. sp. albedinis]|nr:Uncharacterized protein HZ326_1101 [Fusarium oxysporum f. sp. albedinis]
MLSAHLWRCVLVQPSPRWHTFFRQAVIILYAVCVLPFIFVCWDQSSASDILALMKLHTPARVIGLPPPSYQFTPVTQLDHKQQVTTFLDD